MPRNCKDRVRVKIAYTTKPTVENNQSYTGLIVAVNGTEGGMGLAYTGEQIVVDYSVTDYPYNFDPILEADYNGYFVITINFFQGMQVVQPAQTGNIFVDSESLWH